MRPPDGAGRAVFLDRDGTIVDDPPPGFLHHPGRVRLLPGAAGAIRRLNAAGFVVISVTNQSGIARGLYQESDYAAVQRRLMELLAGHGARLDAAYFCPHHPQFTGPCECRKPGTKLFRDAAAAFGVDLSRSFFVGDRLSDVQPARSLGGTGILVTSGRGVLHQGQARAIGVGVADDLAEAADRIVRVA